jgi:hypothetical protein
MRYCKDFGTPIFSGRMVSLSSTGAAFTCPAGQDCAYPGREIVTFLSVPRPDCQSVELIRIAHTYRVDKMDDVQCRVAVRFDKPLPFKPVEAAGAAFNAEQQLQPVTTS